MSAAEYRLDFTIPHVPRLAANGSHGHWAVRNKERRQWKLFVCIAIGKRIPVMPLEKVKCTFIRGTCREPDFDNLVASMKPVRDGLVEAGVVVNDKTENMPDAKYVWQKAPRGHSFTRVLVEEIAA